MAINTRERRQACVGISFYFVGPNVTPNVAKDAEWRQEAGWSYPGIAAGAPVVVTGGSYQHHVSSGARPRRRLGGMNMCFLLGV